MRKLLILAAAFFLVQWSEVNYHFVRGAGMGVYMPHVDRTPGERRFQTFKEATDWVDMMFPAETTLRQEMRVKIVKVEETELPSRGRKEPKP